jgi:hypothetical protein
MVAAVGNGFDKGGRAYAAGLAKQRLRVVTRQGRELRDAQVFPATGAENTGLGRKLRAAKIADRDAGKTQNRAATEGAGGGEQCTGERVCRTSKHTNNSTPNRSLRQRDVGSQGIRLTRKDAPHSWPARLLELPCRRCAEYTGKSTPNASPGLGHFRSMFTPCNTLPGNR